jgi:enamine deaminase RidA (YjgF/YER057c/UK114 family)
MTVEYRNVPNLADPPGYSHVAIGRGTLVFTAGAVPIDERGDLVGENDVVAQTERVIANLIAQLREGGATAADVVKTTVYVAGGSHEAQRAVWEAVQASTIAAAPSTLLGVALLGYRGQLVEIDAYSRT